MQWQQKELLSSTTCRQHVCKKGEQFYGNDCMSTLWRTGIRKGKEVCALRCNIDTRREETLYRCGAELEEGMTECPNCGCPVDDTLGQETDEKPQKVEVTGVKVGIMQCLA